MNRRGRVNDRDVQETLIKALAEFFGEADADAAPKPMEEDPDALETEQAELFGSTGAGAGAVARRSGGASAAQSGRASSREQELCTQIEGLQTRERYSRAEMSNCTTK